MLRLVGRFGARGLVREAFTMRRAVPVRMPMSPAVRFSSTQHSCIRRLVAHHRRMTSAMLKPVATYGWFMNLPAMDPTS
ncbi:MAG: hypothetical protein BWY59_01623 [Verrucomicrobia bacterium ADurb.Bin345]|nr:MAG: hypothetical protein BWY59_01623 [Verrucomicrobia bacterium ADurb.Bin345]